MEGCIKLGSLISPPLVRQLLLQQDAILRTLDMMGMDCFYPSLLLADVLDALSKDHVAIAQQDFQNDAKENCLPKICGCYRGLQRHPGIQGCYGGGLWLRFVKNHFAVGFSTSQSATPPVATTSTVPAIVGSVKFAILR